MVLAALLPTIATANGGPVEWTRSAATGPTASVQPYLSYDSARHRIVLFGGAPTDSSPYYSDTWEFDGSAWSRVATTGPSGRALGQMVYDSARGVSVLFGGSSAMGSYLGETWEWNGSAWVQRLTANVPSPRLWSGMTYDSNRHRVVLFGGASSTANANDTWEYDGNNWVRVVTAHVPAGRFGSGLAFDSKRNRVIMFGGHDSSGRLNDTWEYDGSDWTPITTATAPAPRVWHSMAYDASRQRTVVFGGDYLAPNTLGPNNETWEYDGANWSQRLTTDRPSPRAEAPAAYDDLLAKVVLFGGTDESGRPDVAQGDTWLLGSTPTAPTADLSVSSLAFPQQPVLTTATSTVALSNHGDLPLTIASIAGSGDFSAADDCPRSPASLTSGSTCTVTVSFSPSTGDGSPISGLLTVVDNAGTGTQSIPLSGSGAYGFLAVSPSPADLGTRYINPHGTTASVVVTLTASAQPTVLSGFEASSPFAVSNLDCPLNAPLAPGAACRVQVDFAPTAPGAYSGGLVIHDNEPGLQRAVALSGSAVLPPAGIQVQLSFDAPAVLPTVAHALHILATTDATSGQVTFTFAGLQVGAPVALNQGSASATVNLDDKVIPAGAGDYPLTVAVHSTDGSHADSFVTQVVTVVPSPVVLSWMGSSLLAAGQEARLAVAIQPVAGDTHYVDFKVHPVWVRFELTNSTGAVTVYYVAVKDVVPATGYSGRGIAAVSVAAPAATAYRVRASLVAGAKSPAPSRYAGGDDLRTAFAVHPTRGSWLAGAGEQGDSIAFEFVLGKSPAGSLAWTRPTQVVGADGQWHDADQLFVSTSVNSISTRRGTVTVTGGLSGTIVDAVTGVRYPAFDQATTFTLTVDAHQQVLLWTTGGDSYSGSIEPGDVINNL